MCQGIGEAVNKGIIVMLAILLGAVIGLGGYFGVSWLIEHISIVVR